MQQTTRTHTGNTHTHTHTRHNIKKHRNMLLQWLTELPNKIKQRVFKMSCLTAVFNQLHKIMAKMGQKIK
jgi:hypothetical protein